MRYLPAAAATATGVQVGSAIVASRFVIGQTDPVSLALLRYAIGFCCLLPPALLAGGVRFERRDLPPICLLGVVQFGILVVLLNYAVQRIPSARAALIFSIMPLLTLLLGAAFRLEPLTRTKALGVLLTIVGVALALGDAAARRGGTAGWTGESAAMGSALCGAACSLGYRPYLRKYPALPVSSLAMLASIGFLATIAAPAGFFSSPLRLTTGGWLAVVGIGLGSGVGYFLWLWALGHTTPTRVTVFLALSPVTAIILGALFLGEELTVGTGFGVAGVALGLWFTHHPAPDAQADG